MDVMVTARMTQAKKEAGSAILAKHDMNASQAINKLYDYLIRYRRLPFEPLEPNERDEAEIKEAALWVDAITSDGVGRFGGLVPDDIRKERLGSRPGS